MFPTLKMHSMISNTQLISERRNPKSLSQEEYDRWLAFQLAQEEDELSANELNKTTRTPFRRSRSMPERNVSTRNFYLIIVSFVQY